MTLLEMGPKDLANRLGVSQRKLNKLFKPENFRKLKLEKLALMADIFNIPIANLFQNFLIKEEDQEKLVMEQSATQNPIYHITKLSVK